MQGHGGGALSASGAAQAQRTADYLRQRYPEVGLGMRSDLQRVAETAQPWSDGFSGPVVVDPRLRELDVGAWSGLTWPQIEQREPGARSSWQSQEGFRAGGAETFDELRERVWAAVRERAEEGGVVVMFTHGGPIRAAVAAALWLPPLGEQRLSPVANCSVTELAFSGSGVRLAAYNRRDHL